MKQIVIPAVLFLILTTGVFAQETSPTTPIIPQKREEIKQRIEEKRKELLPKIQEKREEIKNTILEQKTDAKTRLPLFAQERVSKILSHMFERFEAILVKFDGIMLRIEARIVKLEEGGTDMAGSKELLSQAKGQLEEATAVISASKSELQIAIAGDISREEIRNTIEACKISLKQTQAVLVAVIASLKDTGASEEDLSIE